MTKNAVLENLAKNLDMALPHPSSFGQCPDEYFFFLRSTTLKAKPKESKTGNKMVTRNSDQSGDHRKAKFKKFVVP